MSITEELRNFTKDPLLGYASQNQHIERLTAIADHIDAAYEEALGSKVTGALLANEDGTEFLAIPASEMAERYIELPKDADGEYIHVGDEIRDGWHEQNQGEVQRLMLDRYGWWLMLKNNSERFYVHDFHEWHHHKPPTVEDVLCELLDKVDDDRAGQAEIIAEYAKRLRLAGDGE